jgi:transcription termination factor NusB
MTAQLKRISLLVREDQYKNLTEKGINVSGLIRDLLDDYISEHKITLAVSEDTKQLYDLIVSNTGSSDAEVEKYLTVTLKNLLQDKIIYMQDLHAKLDKQISN